MEFGLSKLSFHFALFAIQANHCSTARDHKWRFFRTAFRISSPPFELSSQKFMAKIQRSTKSNIQQCLFWHPQRIITLQQGRTRDLGISFVYRKVLVESVKEEIHCLLQRKVRLKKQGNPKLWQFLYFLSHQGADVKEKIRMYIYWDTLANRKLSMQNTIGTIGNRVDGIGRE